MFTMMKPGVTWVACHKAAEKALLTTLRDGGIVVGDDLDEMVRPTHACTQLCTFVYACAHTRVQACTHVRIGGAARRRCLHAVRPWSFPWVHACIHQHTRKPSTKPIRLYTRTNIISCDTHDVGGYNGCTRIDEPGLRKLRTVTDTWDELCG